MTAPLFDGVALEGRALAKRYGAQIALDGVDIRIDAGEIVALLGANGAGKSTLVKILTGAVRPDAGEIALGGVPVAFNSMMAAAAQGLVTVTQELSLFGDLSVRENLAMAPSAGSGARGGIETRAARAFAALGLSLDMRTRVGRLDLADQQRLEIARALMQNPRVLVLDEPTSSLHRADRERLHEVVCGLRSTGVGILYVTHYIGEAIEVADRIVILRDGRCVAEHGARDGMTVDGAVAAMVGRASRCGGLRPAAATSEGRGLRVDRLLTGAGGRIADVSVARGEVVGLAGLADAGVSDVLLGLFGAVPVRERRGSLPNGRPLPRSVSEAVAAGVAFVTSDRKRTGLMLDQTIAENVTQVAALTLGRMGPAPRRGALRRLADVRCRDLGVRCAGALSSAPGSSRAAINRSWCSPSGWRPSPTSSSSTIRRAVWTRPPRRISTP